MLLLARLKGRAWLIILASGTEGKAQYAHIRLAFAIFEKFLGLPASARSPGPADSPAAHQRPRART